MSVELEVVQYTEQTSGQNDDDKEAYVRQPFNFHKLLQYACILHITSNKVKASFTILST